MLIKKLFSDASQAKLAVSYRDMRVKVHLKIADIYFNKQCLKNKVIPQYARIKMKGNSIAANKTKEQSEIKYVENMIKKLYREKDELSLRSYTTHLQFQDLFGYFAWEMLHEVTSEEIEEIMVRKYEKFNRKLDNLVQQFCVIEENKVRPQHNFQKRVINLTDVQLVEKEVKVLEYGLKHNFTMEIKTEKDLMATDIEANIRILKDVNVNAVRQDITKDCPNKNVKNSVESKKDLKKCKNIKKKLDDNSAIALKADSSEDRGVPQHEEVREVREVRERCEGSSMRGMRGTRPRSRSGGYEKASKRPKIAYFDEKSDIN